MSFAFSLGQGSTARDDAAPEPLALRALGLCLRQAREAQGIAADDLAARLRIGVEQLQALENAELQHLPEPVFVIAQARRVAEALQLDIGPQLQALRDSGELVRSGRAAGLSQPSAHLSATTPTPLAPPAADSRALAKGALRWPWRPALIGLVSLLVLAGLWWGWRSRQRAQLPPGGRAASQAPAPPASEAAPTAPVAASTSTPLASDVIEIESREPSWVEVRRPDGTTLFRGLLSGSRRFPRGDGLEVLAGRPDLVSTRTGSQPSRVLGPISEVRLRSLPPQP